MGAPYVTKAGYVAGAAAGGERPTERPRRGEVVGEHYIPTMSENLATFLEGIWLRISPRKVLIVGPYAGEFGHEIMDFQSFVRGLRGHNR
jgi:hypothetical protein